MEDTIVTPKLYEICCLNSLFVILTLQWLSQGFEPTEFCFSSKRATSYTTERPFLTREQYILIILKTHYF